MSALPVPNPHANDRAACIRKRRYSNLVEANAVAREREAHGAERLTSYKCPECGRFHLTKMGAAA